MADFAGITLRYWPPCGRALGLQVMMLDSGIPFQKVNHDGSPFDSKVFAVPAVNVDGKWYGQTMSAYIVVADKAKMNVPESAKHSSMSCMLTAYDIQSELYDSRGASHDGTKAASEGYVNGRVIPYLTVINEQFGEFDGSCYFGDTPTPADYILLHTHEFLKVFHGDIGLSALDNFPNLKSSLAVVMNRPAVKAYLDSNYNGVPAVLAVPEPLK